jgi:Holliday junction resolvase RusA-like endonuclease
MRFFEPCIPPSTTAQQKGFNGASGQFYKKTRTEDAIATFHQILAPHRPQRPFSEPVAVTIVVVWPWRKSETKKNIAKGRIPHDSKPDLDNWCKQLIDEMVTWRFLERDQQIAELTVRKYWGDKPGIGIAIEPIESDPHERFEV